MKTLKDVISLKFKTSESEGVIFHGEGQQGDYITLELKKAKLFLNLNLGNFFFLWSAFVSFLTLVLVSAETEMSWLLLSNGSICTAKPGQTT